MLTAALTIPGPATGDSVLIGGLFCLVTLSLLLPSALIRIGVWIDEGMPGTAGRLAADRRRKPATVCPTSPDTTHGVAR